VSEAKSASRRRFLKTSAVTAAGAVLPVWGLTKGAPANVAAESSRPQAQQGLHFADPHDGSVVVWSRSDRPARMLVEWSFDEGFHDVQRVRGPHALETTDFTARQALDGLEAGSELFVRCLLREPDERPRTQRAGDRSLCRAARSLCRRRPSVRPLGQRSAVSMGRRHGRPSSNSEDGRNQIIGGIAMGIGMALLEQTVWIVPAVWVTTSLAEYAVPVNADVRDVDVMFVGEHDAMTPLGTKGGSASSPSPEWGRDRQSGLSRDGHAGALVADLH
jgi:hypothetical protein